MCPAGKTIRLGNLSNPSSRQIVRPVGLLLILIAIFAVLVGPALGQEIRDQKEAERIYREGIAEAKNSGAYFKASDECRTLAARQSFEKAEKKCREAIEYALKLPDHRPMERFVAYRELGVTLLLSGKATESLAAFREALVQAKSTLDDTDAETAAVYFMMGQAYHVKEDIGSAVTYYVKAEDTYYRAIETIGDEFLEEQYFFSLENVLSAHIELLREKGMSEEANEVQRRLDRLRSGPMKDT